MTKEDVIEILERFVLGAKPCSQREIVDACASAYRMLKEQPSLPSNLDEAAENRVTENGRFEITQFEKMRIEDIKFGAKWMAGQGWHDITETPSIFGVYLVIHEKGWCVANYMGKGTVCESGWVEVIHHIEIERPQKWLDLRDLIPKKQ